VPEEGIISTMRTQKKRTVPDKQIEDFMFLQDFSDRTILSTHYEDLQCGERVQLEGLASVAMGNYIAKECLERI
jgi:hypothetical protein